MSRDTIAAVATPAGRGGVGIVRVSGEEARDILADLVPKWPTEHPSHKLRLSEIRAPNGEMIDESLVVLMKAPETYTGEDVVEFQCHGGPIILERVLKGAIECGARTAEPGEFTRRAFLNGRLDLTQAEAVADLVNATSESAHKQAMEHLQGRLGDKIRDQMEQLVEARTLVESAIDFSHEEHVYALEREEIAERLEGVLDELETLIERYDQGRRQREGVRVVIAGRPNAGKSTLFNALHGTDRAIVTSTAGTTRDFLEEQLQLGGTLIRLTDTAGLRSTEDEVESIGVERSETLQAKADLVIWVVDQDRPLTEEARRRLEEMEAVDKPTILVRNKIDRENQLEARDEELISRFEPIVSTALVEEEELKGVEALTDLMGEFAERLTTGEGVLLSRARHLDHVKTAAEGVRAALSAIERDMENEIIALEIQDAMDGLGDIVGEVSTEELLGRIFSEFCIGK